MLFVAATDDAEDGSLTAMELEEEELSEDEPEASVGTTLCRVLHAAKTTLKESRAPMKRV